MANAPGVSILIPNYNNGRASSRSGRRDFIADLFQSLYETLQDDPTPLEIIVADDGSTDDSRATCREWAGRHWRGGERFCRLLEFEHTGVLSVIANRLTAEARGSVCCRLDGDIVVRTARGGEKLLETFRRGPPALGVVGPKQLTPDGRIHAFGDRLLHPRGYHHVAQGAAAEAVCRTVEVDHVMGCFYCHRREVWERLGGYDETLLRGQTIDFGLRARLAGWRAFAVPDIEFVHAHGLRAPRATEADSAGGIRRTLDRFAAKWGFDRVAPDLEAVAEKYAGTPLLWNPGVFGPRTAPAPASGRPPDIRRSAWARYAHDAAYRLAVDRRVALVEHVRRAVSIRRPLVQIGSGTGLFSHLLAERGAEVIGIESDPEQVALARIACEDGGGPTPRFVVQEHSEVLPVPEGGADLALLVDVLELHRNPVGLLRAVRHGLGPEGLVLIVARARTEQAAPEQETDQGYHRHELVLQVENSRCFHPLALAGAPAVPGAIVLLGARSREDPPHYAGRLASPVERPPARVAS